MVTIADVARHAGVAPSTVSYVLTRRRSISPETTSRVWKSIRDLGYQPRGGVVPPTANSSIAVVAPLREGVNVAVIMRFVRAITAAARRHDRNVLLVTGSGADTIARALQGPVGGLVVMDVELRDERLGEVRQSGVPSVLIGIPADTTGLTCVDLDFAAAYAMSVDHLADLGHRNIALIGAPKAVYDRGTGFAHHGMAGFTSAALRRGVAVVVQSCDPTGDAVRRVLADRPEVTGFVVHNEAALQTVLTILGSVDRRYSVVAICPDEVAERISPNVTSIHLPAEDLGSRAVELLVAAVDGGGVAGVEMVSPRLTVRQTS